MSPRREETVIVIDRNATTTELTGWRRWLAVGAGYLVLTLITLVGLALFLGLAMTFAMVLVVAVPLAVVLAIIAYATGYLRIDGRRGGP
jgi:Na+/melibiose symporter-like transporter